ncbi:DUF2849 domain-containing protein [Roseibium aggregatum]|uniref:DUF2849 domain-containing protein n=1 Tax=Roseibium aggregatum TaxID=187304 RepID=A0A926S965_9HYPH|nr:DUF2849 domain-containing protein [Roseibium aggregatum]MBD1546204.1 DUF2849 domain-containing protein [Roseibium aggregatum]
MKVVTANRLLDGEVVWLGADENWVGDLARAKLLETKEDVAAAMATAQQSIADREVVEAYDVDVVSEEGRITPKRLRERIRAAGPTILPDLGKQTRAATA